MKSLFLLLALVTGCVTTQSDKPEPKYALGDCLGLSAETLKSVPPQNRAMASALELKVSDVGSTYYVIDQYMFGQLVGRAAVPFADAEKETSSKPCPGTKASEPRDLDRK